MKILVMGLPGSGKTWLAERMQRSLECAWYNADKLRELAGDWDFSQEGRQRQAMRMRNIADFERNQGRIVICDFVCPTKITRTMFKADYTIWVNTLDKGRFEDTNKLFERPDNSEVDMTITGYLSDEEIKEIALGIRDKLTPHSRKEAALS